LSSPTPPNPSEDISPSTEEKTPRRSGFFSSTLEELKLVVWPSRQQLFSESIAVILMVTLSAASIAAISHWFSKGASLIFTLKP
tara:strand:+ start:364 stop:615 length:252 start_codon:yes stop_codon:yes gene_type:complete